ncbi:hypothetical protein NL108_015494 [Boleophthalmus pectinirostris]|uniref:myeloid-associated differentiation marker homolog n=1 Tax=Boleophthalmus pectinirostris TaxID=150288 RepID=UPI0024307215|nr:myeloid-associated differentiation marker homolog [Boleophthalmus pectinirostris]KAJ0059314.1 hypothetical protein NL108_015494 [Boleophthalmus pectinirostris]
MAISFQSSPLLWTRVAALVFTCITFSVAVHGGWLYYGTGDWCIFCWAFSFAGTLLILLVELFGVQSHVLISWKNFPITFACYAALLCLSASIIFPMDYLKGTTIFALSETNGCRIISTIFSCFATIAYMVEVRISKARPGIVTGYMATAPGLLKICQTFSAAIIFFFISDPILYDRFEALSYCMAVYCFCFIVSTGIIIVCVCECTGRLPFSFSRFLWGYTILSVLLYLSVVILWIIYNFDPRNGGERERPSSCRYGPGVCSWDKRMAVAVLTVLNFVLYVADLIYSARVFFVSSEN